MKNEKKSVSKQNEWKMSNSTLASTLRYYYLPSALYYGIN